MAIVRYNKDNNPLGKIVLPQLSDTTNQTSKLLIICIGLGIALAYAVFQWISTNLDEEKQQRVLYWFFITSPIWLTLSILEVVSKIPSITSGDFSPQTHPVTVFAFTAITFAATILASYPAATAFSAIHIWQLTTPPVDPTKGVALASLEKIVRRWRNLTLFILLASITGTLLLNIYLLNLVQLHYEEFGDQLFWLFWAVSGIMILSVLADEKTRYSRNALLATSGHPENEQVQRIVETVSIAAGISVPKLKVIPSSKANAFTLQPPGQLPTIYLTSSLLDLSTDNEIQAVIAHEIAHISSGRTLNYQINHLLLSLLNIISFFSFIILLAAIHPIAPFLWGAIVIRAYLGQEKQWSGEKSGISLIASFLNPPFLLIQFLTYLVYYALSFQEDYLADLKAMEYTRYPEPLYTLIQKLNAYHGSNQFLPAEFYQFYFYGEQSCISTIPIPVPLLDERWQLIRQVDPVSANIVEPSLSIEATKGTILSQTVIEP